MTPPSDEFSINVCTRCGAFLNEDTEACNVCGFEVKDAEPDDTAPTIDPAYDEDKAEGIFKHLLGVSDVGEIEEKVGSGGEIGLCPDCGAFVSPNAILCSVCNASLVEDVEATFDLEQEITELSESNCPNCGTDLPAGISDCNICGFSFFDTDVAVDELDEMESGEGIELATDILEDLDLKLPDADIEETEPEITEEEREDSGIDELLVLTEPDEEDVSDEDFESLMDDIDETVQMESGKIPVKPTDRGKIDLEERQSHSYTYSYHTKYLSPSW